MMELTKKEVEERLQTNQASFLYFYTPLCGTCKVASKMLEVVSALDATIQIKSCNINQIPTLAQQLKIKSVPCLLIIENGEIRQEIYAFHSIEYLHELLKSYLI